MAKKQGDIRYLQGIFDSTTRQFLGISDPSSPGDGVDFDVPVYSDAQVEAGATGVVASTGTYMVLTNGILGSLKVNTPVGYGWQTHGLNIVRTSSGFKTDWNPLDMIPTPTVIYYVDPINGNDVNAGTNTGAPLKNLSTALAKTDVDQIQIINLTSDFVALGVAGWNNVNNQGRSISVLNRTGYRFLSIPSPGLSTWTRNGSFSNVYQVTTGALAVVDLNQFDFPTVTDQFGVVRVSPLKRYIAPVRVNSVAEVAALGGSFFHDGTVLYYRPLDGRDLTVNNAGVYRTSDINNGRLQPTANNLNFYIENIDFIGGNIGFYFYPSLSTISGTVLTFNGCSVQSTRTANGFSTQANNATIYSFNCAAYGNFFDGFSYHNYAGNNATGNNVRFVEINCWSGYNGTTGSTGISDNASTAHGDAMGISIEPCFVNSSDRVMVDVHSAQRWALGGVVGQSITIASGKENIAALDNARVWLDNVYTVPGANDRWVSGQSARLSHYASGTVVNAGTGEATGVIRDYYGS